MYCAILMMNFDTLQLTSEAVNLQPTRLTHPSTVHRAKKGCATAPQYLKWQIQFMEVMHYLLHDSGHSKAVRQAYVPPCNLKSQKLVHKW